MKKNGKSANQYDLFDNLEDGESISQDVLDSIKADNPELFEVLQKSNLLRNSKKVQPDPYFSRVSQIHVYYQLIESKRPKFTPIQNIKFFFSNLTLSPPRLALKPVMTIFLALVLSFSFFVGGVQAADNSRPGQLLYPLDLALEDVQLFLTRDEGSRIRLQLSFAEERLMEAATEFEQAHYEDAETALAGYEEVQRSIMEQFSTKEGTISQEVQKSTATINLQHAAILNGLLEAAPETSQQAILQAIEVNIMVSGEEQPQNVQQPSAPPPGAVVEEPTQDLPPIADEQPVAQGSEDKGDQTKTPSPTQQPTTLPTTTLGNEFMVTVWAYSVNVHVEPGLRSPVIGWLFNNQTITSDRCENGFVYIPEYSGWASGTCFEPNPCGPPGSCLQIED